MAKTPPEKLAAALRANLQKRKNPPPAAARPTPETTEKPVEKPAPSTGPGPGRRPQA
jgi:hypothetical protein